MKNSEASGRINTICTKIADSSNFELIKAPRRAIPLPHKLLYTGLTIGSYLICSKIPLYGIGFGSNETDPQSLRVITASKQGTLMDLGVSPIMVSGLIMQVIQGGKLVKFNKEQSKSFQRMLSLIMAIGTSTMYVCLGKYAVVGFIKSLGVVGQLVGVSCMVLFLDEVLEKGYGVGSATSILSAANVCDSVFWSAFSPFKHQILHRLEFEGSVVELLRGLFGKNKIAAVKRAMFRADLPNLWSLLWTLMLMAVMIFFQFLEISIPVKSVRGVSTSYPIKVFSNASMPLILWSEILALLYVVKSFFSGVLSFMGLSTAKQMLESSVKYLVSPPQGLEEIFFSPARVLLYAMITIFACMMIAKEWLKMSGSSSKDVARQLKQQKLSIPGHRDTEKDMERALERYIPKAAVVGGFIVGVISVLGDLLGVITSGTGILLVISVITQLWDTIRTEQKRM